MDRARKDMFRCSLSRPRTLKKLIDEHDALIDEHEKRYNRPPLNTTPNYVSHSPVVTREEKLEKRVDQLEATIAYMQETLNQLTLSSESKNQQSSSSQNVVIENKEAKEQQDQEMKEENDEISKLKAELARQAEIHAQEKLKWQEEQGLMKEIKEKNDEISKLKAELARQAEIHAQEKLKWQEEQGLLERKLQYCRSQLQSSRTTNILSTNGITKVRVSKPTIATTSIPSSHKIVPPRPSVKNPNSSTTNPQKAIASVVNSGVTSQKLNPDETTIYKPYTVSDPSFTRHWTQQVAQIQPKESSSTSNLVLIAKQMQDLLKTQQEQYSSYLANVVQAHEGAALLSQQKPLVTPNDLMQAIGLAKQVANNLSVTKNNSTATTANSASNDNSNSPKTTTESPLSGSQCGTIPKNPINNDTLAARQHEESIDQKIMHKCHLCGFIMKMNEIENHYASAHQLKCIVHVDKGKHSINVLGAVDNVEADQEKKLEIQREDNQVKETTLPQVEQVYQEMGYVAGPVDVVAMLQQRSNQINNTQTQGSAESMDNQDSSSSASPESSDWELLEPVNPNETNFFEE